LSTPRFSSVSPETTVIASGVRCRTESYFSAVTTISSISKDAVSFGGAFCADAAPVINTNDVASIVDAGTDFVSNIGTLATKQTSCCRALYEAQAHKNLTDADGASRVCPKCERAQEKKAGSRWDDCPQTGIED
jgi:hypothetical protein